MYLYYTWKRTTTIHQLYIMDIQLTSIQDTVVD